MEILENKEVNAAKKDSQIKPPLKKYYKIKRKPQAFNEDQEQSLVDNEKWNKPLNLIVELGLLSPMDSIFSYEGNQLTKKKNKKNPRHKH